MVEPLNKKAWVLVPVEPTPAMVEAGWIDKEDVTPGEIWVAMLSAAPALPAVDGGEAQKLARKLAYTAEINSRRFDDDHPLVGELRQAAALITTQQQQIAALMNERTSLIETKREQIERLTAERDEWQDRANHQQVRAEAAESRVQSLEEEVKRLRRESTDRAYMLEAYGSMLGPTALKVIEMWADKHVKRVLHSWGSEAVNLTGEERAQLLLEWEAAMETAVEIRDIDSHLSQGEKP